MTPPSEGETSASSGRITADPRLPTHESRTVAGIRGHFIAANRKIVEERRLEPSSSTQLQAEITTSEDIGLEGYHARTVASQTDPRVFQETRLVSSAELKRMAEEAHERKASLHTKSHAENSPLVCN